MKYLLDSNILIAASLGTGEVVRRQMRSCDAGDLVTSAIVYAEVVLGSVRGKPPPLDRLHVLLEEIPALDFDSAAARTYARLPFKRAGFDRLIAAHALSLGLILVTHNERHFADIPGLKVENWMQPPHD